MQSRHILGISLGTRTIGMAMIVNGTLVDWYTKSFKQQWSDEKKELILETIDRMLEWYGIDSFAIKVPNLLEQHPTVSELYREINFLAQQKGIITEAYTIDSLKEFCGIDVYNKETLRKKVVSWYPELQFEFDSDSEKKNGYHTKLFEAVLAARLLTITNQIN